MLIFRRLRFQLMTTAAGRVRDIAVGTQIWFCRLLGVDVVAVDRSLGMLTRARLAAKKLAVMDVGRLAFKDARLIVCCPR